MSLASIACGQTGDQDYADKMAKEHKDDTPVASPATDAAPASAVSEARVVYANVGGQDVTGFLAKPETLGENPAGVIVIQEWWGLNENIEAMARQLAGEGYVALAVDLYGGQVATDSDKARELVMAAMGNQAAMDDNLRQAYAYLETQGAKKIGSIGWCFGGGVSLQTALLFPDQLDAMVMYYGRLVDDESRLATLQMPILGFFGGLDQGIPPDAVHAFEVSLHELGKDAEIHVYENANHAFANPSGTAYNADAATDAWARTLAFFAEHLKG